MQMHRPRTDGAGGKNRHNKRVRTPHNTREKQRQIAIGHGETLMPNNVIYRTPNSVMSNEDSAYNSMGGYDGRPNRPSSIEIRSSYPAELVDGYQPTSPSYPHAAYATTQSQQMYDESMYNPQNLYAQTNNQGAMSPESAYAPGTPSRGGKLRPSQPPPAPPSTGNTPNASNANTPTRNRNISQRDALPPPPPVPMENMISPQPMQQMTNGNASVAAKMLARSHSTSRSGSPQLNASGAPMDQNALVMAQLNSQINNLNNLNLQMTQQMNSMNSDLPPPPPIPPISPKQMSPKSTAPQALVSYCITHSLDHLLIAEICFFLSRRHLLHRHHRFRR